MISDTLAQFLQCNLHVIVITENNVQIYISTIYILELGGVCRIIICYNTALNKFMYPRTKPVSLTASIINNTLLLISLFKADKGQALPQGHSSGSILKFNRSHAQI